MVTDGTPMCACELLESRDTCLFNNSCNLLEVNKGVSYVGDLCVQAHAQCKDQAYGQWTCECKSKAYSGEFCQRVTNICDDDTYCENSGTCIMGLSRKCCLCLNGYTGNK